MAKKVPIRTGLMELFVAFPAPFPHGKGHGTIWEFFLDGPNNGAHPLIGKPSILASLKHKGAETTVIAFLTAGKDVLLGQAVTADLLIGTADTAIVTIIFADIGVLHNAPKIDGFSKIANRNFSGQFLGITGIRLCIVLEDLHPFFPGQAVVLIQFFNEVFYHVLPS